MIALFIPWFLIILFLIVIILFCKRKWKVASISFIFCIIINCWFECFPLRFYHYYNKGNNNILKIICFNIDGAVGDPLFKAKKVRNFIHKYSPDIVFLAEFNEQYPKSLDSLLSEDFPYKTFPKYLYFQYFYGKSSFMNVGRLKNEKGKDVGVYTCSIVFKGDTVDLYGCHWASNNYNHLNEREAIQNIKNHSDLFRVINNITSASRQRKLEAESIVNKMAMTSHKAIVLGDMNDVCGSTALKTLQSAGLKDAWWEGGVGYGATIHHPLPYRIDHIMHSTDIKLKKIQLLDSNNISDHDALYAEFIIE